jgi:hypothetical protein
MNQSLIHAPPAFFIQKYLPIGFQHIFGNPLVPIMISVERNSSFILEIKKILFSRNIFSLSTHKFERNFRTYHLKALNALFCTFWSK